MRPLRRGSATARSNGSGCTDAGRISRYRLKGHAAQREEVYFRTTDFFVGADFFRGASFGVGGLRASLTALPAWNRTALLAAISMVSPVCGFRPSRAGRAATAKAGDTDRLAGQEAIENGVYHGFHCLACRRLVQLSSLDRKSVV